jgi:hypothetical protein
MAKNVIVSERWKLSVRDWLKTAALTVGTPMLYEVQKVVLAAINDGTFELNINWKAVLMIGLSAGVTYALKQLTGSPKVTTVYDTNAKATEVAEDIKK